MLYLDVRASPPVCYMDSVREDAERGGWEHPGPNPGYAIVSLCDHVQVT